MSEKNEYDWVAAALAIASLDTMSIVELATAASLDPLNGDFADVDLRGLDIRGQDLSGWDLRYASFQNARIAGTNLQNALIRVDKLIEAQDWEAAELNDDLRIAARSFATLKLKLRDTKLTLRVVHALSFSGIRDVGSLVIKSEAEIIRLPMIGRTSLSELRAFLKSLDLRFGMDILFENSSNLNSQKTAPDIIEFRRFDSRTSASSGTKIKDAAISKFSKEEKIKLVDFHSCRVGHGNFVRYDAAALGEYGATLVFVKILTSIKSAPSMLRASVIRKVTPIFEDARDVNLKIDVVVIIIKHFVDEFEAPDDLRRTGLRFIIYDYADVFASIAMHAKE